MAISSVMVGLLSGIVGWLLTEFFAKPLRRALDLSAEAKARLIEFANVRARYEKNGKSTDLSDFEEGRLRTAEGEYRRLSAALSAFAQTDKGAHFVLKHTLFDAEWAATALMQLSNNFGQYGNGRASATKEAKKALKMALP